MLLAIAFYEKCGFQKKENEMVSFVNTLLSILRTHARSQRPSMPQNVHIHQDYRNMDDIDVFLVEHPIVLLLLSMLRTNDSHILHFSRRPNYLQYIMPIVPNSTVYLPEWTLLRSIYHHYDLRLSIPNSLSHVILKGILSSLSFIVHYTLARGTKTGPYDKTT